MSPTPSPPLPRVLVVDDEIGPRESLRMLLKTHFDVLTADSGPTALRELPRFRPDLVIMDVRMPQMDGLEVLRRIKEQDPSVEVIMITAYASLETVKQALTHGAFEYLIKPFSRQDLEETVRRALTRRRAELGARGQVVMLVKEMRNLAAKTRELEEAARREAAEQSLRVTQLSILREISRGILGQLDPTEMTATITRQLKAALGYDTVAIMPGSEAPEGAIVCPIRDGEGLLGHLVVANQVTGRAIDPRERELLEMLSEYLAIALRNSRLYGEIAETKRSLERLISSAADAIIPIDLGDRVAGWNPAARRIFGLSAIEAIGRAITSLLPEGEYRRAKDQLPRRGGVEHFEVTIGRDDGSSIILSVTLSGVWSSDGQLEGALVIARDITIQRGLEAQVLQSEKLTALGQLAGGIAHDFNNQLQAILGYTQLMKRAPWDLEMVQKALAIVEAAALGGTETVRRIQEFARARPDEALVPVDLNQVVHDAIAITHPRWEEQVARRGAGLELKLDLKAGLPVNGRPAALGEVVTNLILNAIDAMPNGGSLTITTRQEGVDRVILTVSDTGIGMPDSVRQRIFEPFFTTKGQRGSGLGLSVSHSIVKRHGGEIRVESEPGRGTTFRLSFPASTWPTEGAAPPARPQARRDARVLVVDDEPQVLSILTEMLKRGGHTVTTAGSGEEALGVFAPGRFDVVLTDIGMSGTNGWRLAERIRQLDAEVGVLFVTGWGLHETERGQLRRLRVRSCLFKPVRAADLDAAVQDALPAAERAD
jgi:PAS domain S-box-containing protein